MRTEVDIYRAVSLLNGEGKVIGGFGPISYWLEMPDSTKEYPIVHIGLGNDEKSWLNFCFKVLEVYKFEVDRSLYSPDKPVCIGLPPARCDCENCNLRRATDGYMSFAVYPCLRKT